MSSGEHHLAIYNFGVHVAPYGDAAVNGFVLREPLNFEAARRAVGYVGRSGYDGEPGPESWGVQTFPRYLQGSGRDSGPSSLSLWRDIECLMAFSYSGVHADALKHARRWNVPQQWPSLVLFWVSAGRQPEWTEAVRLFEQLADHGPSAKAFTFKQPYDPEGRPYVIDRARVKIISAENVDGQAELMQIVCGLPA